MDELGKKRLINSIILLIGLILFFWCIEAEAQGPFERGSSEYNIDWKYPCASYSAGVMSNGGIQINSPYTDVYVTIIEKMSITGWKQYGSSLTMYGGAVRGSRKFRIPAGNYIVKVDRRGKSMEGVWLGVVPYSQYKNYNPNSF